MTICDSFMAVIKPNGSVIFKQTEGSNSATAVGMAFPVSFVILLVLLIYIINSDVIFDIISSIGATATVPLKE